MSDDLTAWERSMFPSPSVPFGLSHFAAELFGSIIVVAATLATMAGVVFVGGGTGGEAADVLVGVTLLALAVPAFLFGRYLIYEHGVSPREPGGGGGGGRGGGGGSGNPVLPPVGPTALERHVAARRLPSTGPASERPQRSTQVRPSRSSRA